MKKIFFALILVTICNICFGQTSKLKGSKTVKDTSNSNIAVPTQKRKLVNKRRRPIRVPTSVGRAANFGR
jgi:hypothetical protein